MNVRKIGLLLLACCAVVGVSAQSTSALRINEVLTNNVNNRSVRKQRSMDRDIQQFGRYGTNGRLLYYQRPE